MSLQSEKIDLVKRVLNIKDKTLLQTLKGIIESAESQNTDNLPQHVKAGIEKGLRQAEKGLLTPHNEVMKKYAEYL